MDCPRCASSNKIKNGKVNGKQRYKCKECGYNYTVAKFSRGYPKEIKLKALHLYLEGLGFRSIERVLGISHVSVINWIKQFGKEVKELRRENKPIDIVDS